MTVWPFIAESSLLFVLLLTIGAAVICVAVHDDAGWGAAVVLFVVLAFTSLFTTVGLWWIPFILTNWLPLTALWLAGGVTWAFVKWWLFCQRAADRFEAQREQLVQEFEGKLKTPGFLKVGTTFAQWVQDRHGFPPAPRENKDRIITWMIWWPFSVVDTIFSDLVQRLWDRVYRAIANLLARISTSVFQSRFSEFRDPTVTVKTGEVHIPQRPGGNNAQPNP